MGQIVSGVKRSDRHPAHRGGRIGPVGHRQSGGSRAVFNFDCGTGHIGSPQRLERASEKLAGVDKSANTLTGTDIIYCNPRKYYVEATVAA